MHDCNRVVDLSQYFSQTHVNHVTIEDIEFNKIEVLEKYGFSSATLSQGDMFDDE